jgi:response regulator RpfG family c-di-GMP phosphodiesterase
LARILIVDDEESIRTTLGAFVEKAGHEVSLAGDAAEALRLLRESPFDVVVSDIILPRKTGVVLLGEIRDVQPDVQVIMITGEPEVGTAAEAVRKGAFDYLSKPVSRESLAKVIASASRRKALIDETRLLEAENRKHREHLEELVDEQTESLKASSAATERLLQQQAHINELTLALGRSSDLLFLYRTIYDHVRTMMDTAVFIVSFYERTTELIRAEFVVNEGAEMDVAAFPAVPVAKEGRGRQSQVIRTGKALNCADTTARPSEVVTEYTVTTAGEIKEGPAVEEENMIRSAAFVPMLTSGDVIGVIQVQSHRLAAYSQEAVDLLSGMANVAAIAIENARLIQKIREALDSTVRIVGDTVEIRDPYTAGHQRRVTKLACVIAKKLGLPEGKIDGVRVASLLHDIGKMSIPAEILSKPTRLTEIEFALVRQHPQVAHDLLKYISFPWPIAEIVLQHHERMDGSGYPLGLEGKEILPEACILAVSDVVEAMSSHRPYRAALGVSAALEEIKKNRGRLYSEVVVDACVRLFADGEISLEQERWIGDPAYRSGV